MSAKDKRADRNKVYRKENHQLLMDKQRKRRIEQHYGITVDEYQKLLVSQDGRCAICRTTEPRGRGAHNSLSFYIDHDHQTGVVRGLLCHACNTGLGAFRDSSTSMNSAIQYLSEPPALKVIGSKGIVLKRPQDS